jgi:putative ABC transport system ATP-binding protein
MVTHEPRFASWADRVVFLRDGRIVDESTPAPSRKGGDQHGVDW